MILMDRVGGYLDYLALEQDARRYEDVMIVMAGEADAGRIRQMEASRG